MAVIIKEQKTIDGKQYVVSVYKTQPGKLVTEEDKRKAEHLERVLRERMRQIEKQMEERGLLKLKGTKGKVHQLWYEVGTRLEFVMDTSIVPAEDREFVWRALYDYAGNLAPGSLTERARREPETSHFSYCYKLGTFPWEFVDMAGDWTSWSEFFDRRETKNDPRIIQWLGRTARDNRIAGRQNWLRPLTKAIHEAFEKKDTTVFTTEELNERLERIYSQIHRTQSSY
jgi:hypothetical protein